MKATGIVRRIDDIGRVCIPREIRRALNIKDGDALEIYTGKEGEVMFKKYQTEAETVAAECAKIVNLMVAGGIIQHLFVDEDRVTVITPKGKATAKRNPADAFDLNIGAVVALSKLHFCKDPFTKEV